MTRRCSLVHRNSGASCHREWAHGNNHQAWAHYPGQLVVWDEAARQDKRGRRIGRNWWREYNVAILSEYNATIEDLDGTNHQMEPAEFKAAHPLVNLKALLIGNAGMHRPPEEVA